MEAIRRCSRAWKDVAWLLRALRFFFLRNIACIACFQERKSLMQMSACVTILFFFLIDFYISCRFPINLGR
jgi:hypothetical protein